MNKKSWAVLLLIFPFYLSSQVALSIEKTSAVISSEDLYEAFVLLRIRDRTDPFYRVMMDENEQPYLNVAEVFKWLEFQGGCDVVRNYCQVQHPLFKKIHWIDGRQLQHSIKNSGAYRALNPGLFLQKEGAFWLRFDVWGKWLPASVHWTLSTYTAALVPGYKSIANYDKERRQHRDQVAKEYRLKQSRLRKPPLLAGDDVNYEARYSISGRKSNNRNLFSEVSYDINAAYRDYLLRVSGSPKLIDKQEQIDQSITIDNAADTELQNSSTLLEEDDVLDYWNFSIAPRPKMNLFEIGNATYPSSLLVPSLSSESAVRFERMKRSFGTSHFEYQGVTEPGSEVELYINGIFQESVFAEESGEFEFARRFVSSGDRIVMQSYHSDGRMDEQSIDIAVELNPILTKGQWDARLFSGPMESQKLVQNQVGNKLKNQVTRLEYQYGFALGLSPTFFILQLPLPDFSDETIFAGMDISLKPSHSFVINAELLHHSIDKSDLDYAVQIDFSPPGSHTLQWSHSRLSEQSPLLVTDVFLQQSPKIDRLIYGFQKSRWQFIGTAEFEEQVDRLISRVNRRFNRDLNMSVELTKQFLEAGEYLESGNFGINYRYNRQHAFNFTHIVHNFDDFSSLRYRYQAPKHFVDEYHWYFPISGSLQAIIDEAGEVTGSANVAWKLSARSALSLSVNSSSILLQATWREGWRYSRDANDQYAMKPLDYSDFGQGSVSGYLFTPKSVFEEVMPLDGVQVKAGTEFATTDQNGYYRLDGLPVNRIVELQVDQATLDATLIPKKKRVNVKLWPASNISYNPKLSWTAGFDGYVDFPEGLIPDEIMLSSLSIVITDKETGEELQAIEVEQDGYFMGEGLYPGQFVFSFAGILHAQTPLEVNIPEGVDWVSDLDFEYRIR